MLSQPVPLLLNRLLLIVYQIVAHIFRWVSSRLCSFSYVDLHCKQILLKRILYADISMTSTFLWPRLAIFILFYVCPRRHNRAIETKPMWYIVIMLYDISQNTSQILLYLILLLLCSSIVFTIYISIEAQKRLGGVAPKITWPRIKMPMSYKVTMNYIPRKTKIFTMAEWKPPFFEIS